MLSLVADYRSINNANIDAEASAGALPAKTFVIAKTAVGRISLRRK